MFNRQNLRFFLFLLFVYFLIIPKISYAYLDPGTGSYIVQIVLAGLLSLVFMLKNFWSKLFNNLNLFFSKKKIKQKNNEHEK